MYCKWNYNYNNGYKKRNKISIRQKRKTLKNVCENISKNTNNAKFTSNNISTKFSRKTIRYAELELILSEIGLPHWVRWRYKPLIKLLKIIIISRKGPEQFHLAPLKALYFWNLSATTIIKISISAFSVTLNSIISSPFLCGYTNL